MYVCVLLSASLMIYDRMLDEGLGMCDNGCVRGRMMLLNEIASDVVLMLVAGRSNNVHVGLTASTQTARLLENEEPVESDSGSQSNRFAVAVSITITWVEPEGDGDNDIQTCQRNECGVDKYRKVLHVLMRMTPSSQLDLPSATT